VLGYLCRDELDEPRPLRRYARTAQSSRASTLPLGRDRAVDRGAGRGRRAEYPVFVHVRSDPARRMLVDRDAAAARLHVAGALEGAGAAALARAGARSLLVAPLATFASTCPDGFLAERWP
jgi:hypothetical protein